MTASHLFRSFSEGCSNSVPSAYDLNQILAIRLSTSAALRGVVLGHASSTPLCLAPLLRREHRGVGRRRRYQHCREAIVFQVEFLVGVSELIDRGAALGHQELEAADLVLVAFHGGAQTHDRNLQFGASARRGGSIRRNFLRASARDVVPFFMGRLRSRCAGPEGFPWKSPPPPPKFRRQVELDPPSQLCTYFPERVLFSLMGLKGWSLLRSA